MRIIKSELALILAKEIQQKLNDELKNEPINIREFFGSNCDKKKVDAETGLSFYYWKSVVWYVDLECEFLDQFLIDQKITNYRLVRICENDAQVEISGRLKDNPFDLRAVTEIKFKLN